MNMAKSEIVQLAVYPGPC